MSIPKTWLFFWILVTEIEITAVFYDIPRCHYLNGKLTIRHRIGSGLTRRLHAATGTELTLTPDNH
jgi:hypothetical protein